MGDTFTSRNRIRKPEVGKNKDLWGSLTNNDWDMLDVITDGFETLTTTGGTTTLVFTDGDPASTGVFRFLDIAGVLVSPAIIQAPEAKQRWWFVRNSTTGAFTVTFKTALSTGVVITAGETKLLWEDGASAATSTIDTTPRLNHLRAATGAVDFNGQQATGGAAGALATDFLTGENSLDDLTGAVGANVPMNTHKFTGLLAGTTSTNDSVSMANEWRALAVPTASVPMNAQKLTGLADGAAATQDSVTVNQMTGAITAATIPAGNGMVKVDGSDTTNGFLFAKLTAGSGIDLTVTNVGGNETVQIDVETVQLNPVGMITMYGAAAAPTGWLLCNGASLLRASYAALFTAIGTTYGSADGTHFNAPNLQGKFPIGYNGGQVGPVSGGVNTAALGNSGGEGSHTLITAEMPTHDHSGGSLITLSGTKYFIDSAGGGTPNTLDSFTGVYGSQSSTATITTVSTGGGGAHNNVPPVLTVNFIIYAGV